MELRQMRWFTILAEELHYGRAAQRIPVAISALSKAMQQLERSVGVDLIDRSRRNISLTPAGTEFLSHAHLVLAGVDNAIRSAQIAERNMPDTIRLGVFENGAAHLNGPIIRAMKRLIGERSIELIPMDFTGHFDPVADGRVDLAIVRPPTSRTDVELHPLFSEPVSVMLNARHELAEAGVLSVGDIVDQTFAHGATPGSEDEWVSYWRFDDIRQERASLAGSPANNISQVLDTIASNEAVLTSTAASIESLVLDPAVTLVPLADDDRRSHVAIATSRSSPTPFQPLLIDAARAATAEMIEFVPGGRIETEIT